jgi:hypothetical protein
VGIVWRDGRLVLAKIRSVTGKAARLRYGAATRELELKPGKTVTWKG